MNEQRIVAMFDVCGYFEPYYGGQLHVRFRCKRYPIMKVVADALGAHSPYAGLVGDVTISESVTVRDQAVVRHIINLIIEHSDVSKELAQAAKLYLDTTGTDQKSLLTRLILQRELERLAQVEYENIRKDYKDEDTGTGRYDRAQGVTLPNSPDNQEQLHVDRERSEGVEGPD